MKELNVTVLKKNRKYFAIRLDNGFECKLLIDEASNSLELGAHKLLCDDISVRTKFGTDVIYKVSAEIKSSTIITLVHRYNADLVDQCRKLAGKFDEASKAWVFSDVVSNEVEQLDELYNDDPIVIDIETIGKKSTLREPIYFCGYPLATAYGRDSGAKLSPDVVMLSGTIGSDGSMKNWGTYCTDDSIFRITIGRKLLEKHRATLETKWIITVKE